MSLQLIQCAVSGEIRVKTSGVKSREQMMNQMMTKELLWQPQRRPSQSESSRRQKNTGENYEENGKQHRHIAEVKEGTKL